MIVMKHEALQAKLQRLLPVQADELAQIMAYADGLPSAEAVGKHFAGLLGESEQSLDWINAYNAQRWPLRTEGRRKEESGRKGHARPTVNARKVDSIGEIDAAIRALEQTDIHGARKRKACNCQASRHALCLVAPNCLNCGKIICMAEGIGPCTFCRSPIISRQQQLAIAAELRQAKSAEKMAMHNTRRKTPAGSHGGGSNRTWQEDLGTAEARKEELLGFQEASAQRSVIIDQAGDLETPDVGLNKWSSPAERALQLRQQHQQLAKLEREKRRVMTIDLVGKKVVSRVEQRLEEKEEAPLPEVPSVAEGERMLDNPLANEFARPVYLQAMVKKPPGPKTVGWRRLQDDHNLTDNDSFLM